MSMQTNKNTSTKAKKPIKQCNYCDRKGHTESNCYKKNPSLFKNKTINNSSIINSSNKEEEVVLNSSIKSTSNNTIDFILDSGATIHTCYIKELFTSLEPTTTSIKWGNTSNSIKAQGVGNIQLVFTSTQQLVTLTNVLFVPELGVNLLSLGLITSKGFSLSFNKENCYINKPNNSVLATGVYKEGVSVFKATSPRYNPISSNKTYTTVNTFNSALEEGTNLEELENTPRDSSKEEEKESIVVNKNTVELAHARLGHINLKALKHLLNSTKGAEFMHLEDVSTASISLENCIPCIQAKITKKRNKEASTKATAYLDLIYIDIGGPIKPKALKGYKYYITFRDAYSKYLVVKLLRSRENIVDVIRTTIEELELEAKSNSSSPIESSKPFNNNRVKTLQLDNKFKSKALEAYLVKKGIIVRYSAPYTPEQNGAAEIINRVLLNKVRALLNTSNLPKIVWGEALLTACYLYNRTPNSSIEFKTPYCLKYKQMPNISNIRVFGSLTYYKEPSMLIKKLDSKAIPFYLIGFVRYNIYKLYNPSSNKIITARDCQIIEGYYYKPNNNTNIQTIFTRLESNNKPIIRRNPRVVIPKRPLIKDNSVEDSIEDSADKLANPTIIEDSNTTSLESIITNTIQEVNNKQDWQSLYKNAILENILATSNSKFLEEPKSFKEVLLRKDKDLYLNAMQTEIEDLIKSNT